MSGDPTATNAGHPKHMLTSSLTSVPSGRAENTCSTLLANSWPTRDQTDSVANPRAYIHHVYSVCIYGLGCCPSNPPYPEHPAPNTDAANGWAHVGRGAFGSDMYGTWLGGSGPVPVQQNQKR